MKVDEEGSRTQNAPMRDCAMCMREHGDESDEKNDSDRFQHRNVAAVGAAAITTTGMTMK